MKVRVRMKLLHGMVSVGCVFPSDESGESVGRKVGWPPEPALQANPLSHEMHSRTPRSSQQTRSQVSTTDAVQRVLPFEHVLGIMPDVKMLLLLPTLASAYLDGAIFRGWNA